jgi:hypothetical protein
VQRVRQQGILFLLLVIVLAAALGDAERADGGAIGGIGRERELPGAVTIAECAVEGDGAGFAARSKCSGVAVLVRICAVARAGKSARRMVVPLCMVRPRLKLT